MKKIIIFFLLLVSTLKADNVSFSGSFEITDLWKESDYFIELDISPVMQFGYGLDCNENQQVNFLAGFYPERYDLGINWKYLIRPYKDKISGLGIGSQVVLKHFDVNWKNNNGWSNQIAKKYAEGHIQSNYLTPSLVVDFDKYFYNFGIRLHGNIGYNFIISEDRQVKYNEEPQSIAENSMQSDTSYGFGISLLYNLP